MFWQQEDSYSTFSKSRIYPEGLISIFHLLLVHKRSHRFLLYLYFSVLCNNYVHCKHFQSIFHQSVKYYIANYSYKTCNKTETGQTLGICCLQVCFGWSDMVSDQYNWSMHANTTCIKFRSFKLTAYSVLNSNADATCRSLILVKWCKSNVNHLLPLRRFY